MSVWKELTDAWAWKETWGDFDTVEESINASKKMQLYFLDLPFAFFLSPPGEKGGNALSLITLSFHSVRLAIQPQSLEKCVAGYADGSSTTQLIGSDGSADQAHDVTTIVRDGQSVSTAASASTGLTAGRLALVTSSTSSVSTRRWTGRPCWSSRTGGRAISGLQASAYPARMITAARPRKNPRPMPRKKVSQAAHQGAECEVVSMSKTDRSSTTCIGMR